VFATDGAVRGVVWFDRDADGIFDRNEWVLPGVTVTLGPATTGLTSQALRLEASSLPLTAVTGADGSYLFSALTPGAYRVTAAATIRGFGYTSDTDGLADWIVDVRVVARTTSIADYAGLGRGAITGQVFDTTTLQGLAAALIECRWSGYDDVLGNADDTTFSVVADAGGSFDLTGLPYGYFSCDGRDEVTGRQSLAVAATVFSVEAVQAPLPVEAPPAGMPTGERLPEAGSTSSTTLAVASLLVGLGALVIAMTRRWNRSVR